MPNNVKYLCHKHISDVHTFIYVLVHMSQSFWNNKNNLTVQLITTRWWR